MLERCQRKSEKLFLKSKESDRKLTQLTTQLTTADLKNRLFEDQVKMLERDLKAHNLGTSDNLNDAIEVSIELILGVMNISTYLTFTGKKCCSKGEK